MTTESLAYAGALLLGIATLPQAYTLLRDRDVAGFGWTFSVFNFVGLACLALRSLAIQEWAFLGINLLTTSFWGMVVVLKVRAVPAARPAPGPAASGDQARGQFTQHDPDHARLEMVLGRAQSAHRDEELVV